MMVEKKRMAGFFLLEMTYEIPLITPRCRVIWEMFSSHQIEASTIV